ncbi:MAG: hypothetical protein ABJA80_15815 [bacterium]
MHDTTCTGDGGGRIHGHTPRDRRPTRRADLPSCAARLRRLVVALTLVGAGVRPAAAQDPVAADTGGAVHRAPHYWRDMAGGFAASLLAHESAHVVTALVLGGHPTFGFDKGRPTVYSGFDATRDRRKQFLFSSMGLNVQAAIDETVLDVPHNRGAAFERGMLTGGLATALFYITIGRTAAVSDVDYMARTSSLTKTDIALIYGGVAAMHIVRIRRDGRYADFFVRPDRAAGRGLRVGVQLSPE